MTAALDIRGVRKTIGQVSILQDIDITLEKGEFLVLVGPSGSGKSTLLSCIAGLADVSGGQILIGGRDMTYVKPADRDIAVVFQSYALFPTMTVEENITFGMRVRKVSEAERKAHLARVAAQLKIDHLLDRKPGQLSGGQRQRVAMARALVRDPELFLFDEPLSNLDAKLRVSMRSEIKRLHQALDASIVYVTHDQIEAMTLATRIAVLRDGRIQQIGTPADVYDRPANLFVADFMGSPPMNLIPARATAGEGGLAVRFGTDGPVLFDSAPPPALAGAADQPIVFGIRPETLALAEPGDDPRTVAEIAVDLIEPTGSDLYAMATVAGADFVARLPARAEISAGRAARFAFDLSRACYFDPKTEARL